MALVTKVLDELRSLPPDRDLGVILETFNGPPGADYRSDARSSPSVASTAPP